MSFMQPEVYEDEYYAVEANHGETHIVPRDVHPGAKRWKDLESYVEGRVDNPQGRVKVQTGWLYRMQAPGYLDSTDWGVADTEREAYRELLECYGTSDGEREDWEDEACEQAGVCKACGNDVPDGADYDGHCSVACQNANPTTED